MAIVVDLSLGDRIELRRNVFGRFDENSSVPMVLDNVAWYDSS